MVIDAELKQAEEEIMRLLRGGDGVTAVERRLKYCVLRPITNGIGAAAEYDDPSWPRYVRITDIVGPRKLRDDTFMSLPPEQAAEALFDVGDILAAAVGATFGKTYLHATDIGPAAFAGYLVRISPSPDFEPRFVAYWSESRHYWDQVNTSVVQSTIPNFSAAKYAELRLPAPPLDTQRAIADYLDRETARLDALVAAKERGLRLLDEKRRALITRAVTRGLDPRAPLRDSDIPWLGEIPAHWEVWKLGHSASVGNGSTPSRGNAAYWTEGTIPWLNSSVVNQYEVTQADQFVTQIALRECHLPLVKSGSVLVAITGQGKTRGQAVVLSFDATINQHLAYISPDLSQLDPWFLRWTLLVAYEFLRSISDDAGGTKGALTCENVANVRMPVPPIDEQRAIVAHIANGTSKLDELRSATERTTVLLKERRAALIGAAVTGELEVT